MEGWYAVLQQGWSCMQRCELQERGELLHERNIAISEPVAVKLHARRRDSHQWAMLALL